MLQKKNASLKKKNNKNWSLSNFISPNYWTPTLSTRYGIPGYWSIEIVDWNKFTSTSFNGDSCSREIVDCILTSDSGEQKNIKAVRCLKAFNRDRSGKLYCRDIEYETETIQSIPLSTAIQIANFGFHACFNLKDCYRHYPENSVICEVFLFDEVYSDGIIVCGRSIFINRKLDYRDPNDLGSYPYSKSFRYICNLIPATNTKYFYNGYNIFNLFFLTLILVFLLSHLEII